jgi:hypothetical protein
MRLCIMIWLGINYILFICTASLQAQNSTYHLGLGYLPGQVIKHTPKLVYNPPPHSYIIQLSVLRKTGSSQAWMQNYKSPTIAYTLAYTNTLDTVLGKQVSFTTNINWAFVNKKRWQLFARFGTGMAYSTKYYKRTNFSDTLNNYLGSAINMAAYLGIGSHVVFNKNWCADAGLSLSHASNGAIHKPNYGINIASANATVYYTIPATNFLYQPSKEKNITNTNTKNKFGFTARAAFTQVEYGNANSALMPVYTGAIMANYFIKNKYKLLLGLDYEYNFKTVAFIKQTNQTHTSFYKDAAYLCAIVGNEFLLGKFSLPVQLGVYLNNAYLQSASYYQKFGLLYYPFTKQYGHGWHTGVLLKSNAFNASLVEFCIGYTK